MTVRTVPEIITDVSETVTAMSDTIDERNATCSALGAENDALIAQVAALTPPPIARVTPTNGVFLGTSYGTPQTIAQRLADYDAWLYSGAKTTPLVIDFAAHDTWASADGSLALLGDYLTTRTKWCSVCPPARLVLGWPLVTSEKGGAAGFAEILTGARDSILNHLGTSLIKRGLANTIIRLGWEMNGDWYPWGAAQDSVGYIRAFRYVVTYLRSLPGAQFQFVWNPNYGLQRLPWTDCYPGSLWVDYIGFDTYDMWLGHIPEHTQEDRWQRESNAQFGLRDIAAFARCAGKPLCIPEWGTGQVETSGEGGGTENPFFVQKMWEFITDPANNVAWHAYWNRDAGSGYTGQIFPTNLRPITAAKYKELFGS